MAKDTEVSDAMSSMTKEGMERVREGMENYFEFLKQIISAYPSGGTELGEKLKNHAGQNVAALQEQVTKLSQAKTIQGVIRIRTEFVQSQFSAFGEQARDLVATYSKAAEDVTKIPSP